MCGEQKNKQQQKTCIETTTYSRHFQYHTVKYIPYNLSFLRLLFTLTTEQQNDN